VTISAGTQTASQTTQESSKSLAVGRVIGGTVVDTARSIRDGIEAAKDADDPRLKAVKLAQVALNTYNLGGQAVDANGQSSGFKDKQGGTASNGSLIKIGTELSNTRSKSSSEYHSETARQSTLNAGQALSIVATGKAAETQGDIHVIGSDLKAANTTLVAKNDIILESAQNTTERKNDSKNDKTSIGASFNIGEQNGFTLDLGAQIAKNMGSGSSVTQVNSTLETGALVLNSGQDTTLAGAQVRADSIKADIGGDLNIASRQDIDTQKSKQSSAGAGASICVPPFCYGTTVAASGSVAVGDMNSDYKAVTDQTGLYAGQGGYDINVGKTTTLQGAVIASEASADKNQLDTDRLLTSDIKNTSKIKSTSASAGISGSSSGLVMGPPMGAVLSESDSSKTRAAVSEGTIVVRNPEGASDLVGLNRDTQNANKHLDKPDEKAMRERMDLINSSAELARTIGSTIAKAKIDESEDPNSDTGKAARQKLLERGIAEPTPLQVRQQAESDYGVGSSFQRTTQTVTAIVQGIAGGNVGAAIAGASAPYLAQQVKDMTAGDDAANLMAHAVLGAVLARASGNSALVGAGGAVAAEATAKLIRNQLYGDVSNQELTAEQKQTISALSTLVAGVAGSAVGKDALSAVAAAQVGKNAVENNALSDLVDAASQGKTPQQVADERVEAQNERYKQRNCAGMSAEACSVKMYTQRREELKDILTTGVDFVPVVGDIKSFAEAHSALDYLAATIGIIPGAGDVAGKLIKGAEKALKAGDIETASKLINRASNEIQGAKVTVPSKTAVQELEVDAYKNLKAREVVGDGLEHDHIPSFAALRTAKEAELGRPLTELETKTLYQNSTAVEVPRDVHIAGPTYGGKNTAAQIQQDAADLCGAVCRDTDALRANLNNRGYDSKLVDETVQKIVERNRKAGVIK
jgi:filamentous hemagglutinin